VVIETANRTDADRLLCVDTIQSIAVKYFLYMSGVFNHQCVVCSCVICVHGVSVFSLTTTTTTTMVNMQDLRTVLSETNIIIIIV